MNNQDFGKFICFLRKEKGLTQSELADRLHVSDKAVSRWENGKNYPDIEILEDLGKELGVSISELIACKKIETPDNAEIETAKIVIGEVNRTRATRNRFVTLFAALLTIVLIVLFLPTSFKSYDDGGTREIQALTYKIVRWNKMLSPENFYHKTSVYFLSDAQKHTGDLWKKEKISLYQRNTYISDIRSGAVNIGAEMPEIIYMDDSFVVFFGTCGLIKYDYNEKTVENRINSDCLNFLGYDAPYAVADRENKKIYIQNSPFGKSDILPLSYSVLSDIVKREDVVPKIQYGSTSELSHEIQAAYGKKGFLTSFNYYSYCDGDNTLKAFLIADDNWNMGTLKLVLEKGKAQTKCEIFG